MGGRIDQGSEAIGGSRKNRRYSQEFKLKAVEVFLRGEVGYRSPAIEYEVRNSTQIRDWVKRYWEGGEARWPSVLLAGRRLPPPPRKRSRRGTPGLRRRSRS